MKQAKLNYRFHNPNEACETAEYIARILVKANQAKLEQVIQEIASQTMKVKENHSM